MDVLENDKESTITLQDFPFICRICCLMQNDLVLFEDYLLDLFQATCDIDVRSRVEYPRTICRGCINKMEDILCFINVSKLNDASVDTNIKLKKEVTEYTDSIENGRSRKSVGTTHENEEDMCHHESPFCRICLSPSSLTAFEKKLDLMQLFQNITNIDVTIESNSKRNSICNKCINQLEKISSFICSSVCNNQKLENAIGINETIKTEYNSGTIDFETVTCQEFKLENEAMTENSLKENTFVLKSEVKSEIIDIKEEIIDDAFATSTERKYKDELNIHSQTNLEETPFEGFSIKEKLEEESQLPLQYSSEEKSSLQTHMLTLSEKKLFKCNICEKSLTRNIYLQRHMLIHRGEKPFQCESCGKNFTSKRNLKRHLFTHSDEKLFKCDICEKSFRWKVDLRRHALIHIEDKPFKCDCCEKSYNLQSQLKHHMFSHVQEKPYKCDICEKSFTRKIDLQRHSLIHTGKKPFQCDICGKSFNRKLHLKEHLLIHSGEKPFKCNSCEKSFNRKLRLNQHLLIHSGEKSFKCDWCEKSFTLKSTLRKHFLIHTRDKDISFKCDICEKSFSRKNYLQRHLLIHSGMKPFKCDCCERSFTHKLDLQRHLSIHSGEKPLKCDCCEKSFAQKRSLKRHLLIHTGEK